MTNDDTSIAGKLTDRMLERLVAKIDLAVRSQMPEVQAAYEQRIAQGAVLHFSESDDAGSILVTIDLGDGHELPLCDATYAELRGELLH